MAKARVRTKAKRKTKTMMWYNREAVVNVDGC